MKTLFTDILYIRRRDRKSLLIIVIVLCISSFLDEAFFYLSRLNFTHQKIEEFSIIEKGDITVNALKPNKPIKIKQIHKDSSQSPFNNSKKDSLKIIEKPLNLIPIKTLLIEEKNLALFDPNQLNKEELVSLGISEYAANNWIKYLDAGGRFYKPNDLNKIYGLKEDILEKMSGRLLFPKKYSKPIAKNLKVFDINLASKEEFMQIQGIGNVLSERIIKFRDKLGGFHSPEQLKEVYGLEETLIDLNYSLFEINTEVKRLNINTISEIELGIHPYFSTALAKNIINYRKQNGTFVNSKSLEKIKIIQSSWIEKVNPYLVY